MGCEVHFDIGDYFSDEETEGQGGQLTCPRPTGLSRIQNPARPRLPGGPLSSAAHWGAVWLPLTARARCTGLLAATPTKGKGWEWGFHIDLNAAVYTAFPQELTRVLPALIISSWFPTGVNAGPLG